MEENADDITIPRGIALTWGISAHPQRGPKRELSLEKIVEAAMEIADADGLAALSMSAVAKRLGFTTMSLYRYVTNKDELLAVMSETGYDYPPLSVAEAPDWKTGLTQYYREMFEIYTTHPWMLDLPFGGVPASPASLSWLDAVLTAMRDTPFNWLEKTSIHLVATGLARWSATVEREYDRQASVDGVTTDDLDQLTEHILSTLVTSDQFPSLRQALDAGIFSADSDPFTFGWERVIDGVSRAIDERVNAGMHEQGNSTDDVEDPSEPVELPLPESFPKDPKVKKRRTARRDAQKQVRDAERKLKDAIAREREAVAKAQEREASSS